MRYTRDVGLEARSVSRLSLLRLLSNSADRHTAFESLILSTASRYRLAPAIARWAVAWAKWRRYSSEANRSPLISTPSVACDAALVIVCRSSLAPIKLASTAEARYAFAEM